MAKKTKRLTAKLMQADNVIEGQKGLRKFLRNIKKEDYQDHSINNINGMIQVCVIYTVNT